MIVDATDVYMSELISKVALEDGRLVFSSTEVGSLGMNSAVRRATAIGQRAAHWHDGVSRMGELRENDMQETNYRSEFGWSPSVYYAEIFVNSTIARAWDLMLDYQAWNPSFVGADVLRMNGAHRSEGEVVQIRKRLIDVDGTPLPEFYAETVKVVPYRNIVWYAYRKCGDGFRNFVDFGLSEDASGVKFRVSYYAQSQFTGELLLKQRLEREETLKKLVIAFKSCCEAE